MSGFTRIRWLPALILIALGAITFGVVQNLERFFPTIWPYHQSRSMANLITMLVVVLALIIWWLGFSRAPKVHRYTGVGLLIPAVLINLSGGQMAVITMLMLTVCSLLVSWFLLYRGPAAARALAVVLGIAPAVLIRFVGMTGDFLPILEPRFWGRKEFTELANPLADATKARPDFPQFLGPNRNGVLSGPELEPDWAAHPPVVVWRKSVGVAWSGFAVVGGRAVTQEEKDGQEWVTCSDLATGKELWRTSNPGTFYDSLGGAGPRATPAIADGRVFTLGSTGILRCTDLADGKILWSRDLKSDTGVGVPQWGFSSSPLVHDGKVIVSAGGKNEKSLVAYRTSNGEPAWSAGTGEINYSSPFLRTLAGREQILMFNAATLSAHDPATGALLWEYGWSSGRPNVAQPVVAGPNRVLISSGYAYGSELVEISPVATGGFNVSRVWKSARFQAKFSNPVEKAGYVYGLSDGDFACLDLRDGSRKWKGGSYGHGQGLLVGDYYLQVAEEKGDIVLLKPTPEAPNELGRFNVFSDKTWNPIALCGDLLLMRNDREAACLRLPLKAAASMAEK